MKSIYFKNFFLMSGMVLVSFLIFGIAFNLLLRNYTIADKQDMLYNNAELISNQLAGEMARYGMELPDMDLQDYADDTSEAMMKSTGNASVGVVVADVEGTVLSASYSGSPMDSEQILSANILKEIDSSGKYASLGNMNGIFNAAHYFVGVPIKIVYMGNLAQFQEKTVGYVFLSTDASNVMRAWSSFAAMFIVVAAGVLMVSIFLSVVTAARQSAPLKEMAAVANKFAHGDFSSRVTDRGRIDEIGELTGAFNVMANALERSENLRREFVANVSHELKTPMTSITGFAEGILDGTIPTDKQQGYLSIIASETKRLSRLVRSMLDASQVQSLDPAELKKKSFNISEVLVRTLLSLERKINEKELDVDTDLPDKPAWAKGNGDAIMQVVYNLLDNAIKFSEKGANIGIRLYREGGKIKVGIRNEGETISSEELALIFDRFHKTDKSRSRDREGVGLGLHIVKTILNSHNEDISATSEDGVTEFVFTLTPETRRMG